MNCAEYLEWVAADADGISGADTEVARRHAESCSSCRKQREGQATIRSLLRSRSLGVEAPFGLRTRLLATLDEEAERGTGWFARLCRWGALAAVCLAALLAVTPPRGGSIDPMIESYYQALRGELPLDIRTSARSELERFYKRFEGQGVRVHVVDLESTGFRLVGGAVREIGGRRVRLSVYSDGENVIVCDYRPPGAWTGALPDGNEPLFFVRGGLTLCVRRMGSEICVLATRMPMHLAVSRLLGWT